MVRRAALCCARRARGVVVTGCGARAVAQAHKKESILNLKKYIDRPIRVKFSGGREGTYAAAAARGIRRSPGALIVCSPPPRSVWHSEGV